MTRLQALLVVLALITIPVAGAIFVLVRNVDTGEPFPEWRPQVLLMTVSGQEVTSGDLAEAHDAVQQNLVYMEATGRSLSDFEQREFVSAFAELIELTGLGTVALASLIEEQALYAGALERGFAPSEAEVAEAVEAERARVDELRNAGKTTEAELYIDAFGEERYWTEIVPSAIRTELALLALRDHAHEGVSGDNGARTEAWIALKREIVGAAEIGLHDETVTDGDLAAAKIYLDYYWQLERHAADLVAAD